MQSALRILRWTFFVLLFYALGLVILAIVLAIPLIGAEWISSWQPGVALVTYTVLSLGSAASAALVPLSVSESKFKRYAKAYRRGSEKAPPSQFIDISLSSATSEVLIAGIIFVVATGQFFRHWQLMYGGFSTPGGTSYWDWVLYASSWILDNILANFGQIFDREISPIHPVSQPARILTFGYNVLVIFIVLANFVGLLRRSRNNRRTDQDESPISRGRARRAADRRSN